jgi:hypothetical protein
MERDNRSEARIPFRELKGLSFSVYPSLMQDEDGGSLSVICNQQPLMPISKNIKDIYKGYI